MTKTAKCPEHCTLRQARRDECARLSQMIYASVQPALLEKLSLSAQRAFLGQIHPKTLERQLCDDRCYWLLEKEGQMIATLGLQQGFHLHHLFVLPEHQRQGLAQSLWQHLQQVRQPRYFSVYAWPKAVPLYYRWGFRPLGKTIIRAHMPVVPMIRFNEGHRLRRAPMPE